MWQRHALFTRYQRLILQELLNEVLYHIHISIGINYHAFFFFFFFLNKSQLFQCGTLRTKQSHDHYEEVFHESSSCFHSNNESFVCFRSQRDEKLGGYNRIIAANEDFDVKRLLILCSRHIVN